MRGKVIQSTHNDTDRRDHPRVCGEKLITLTDSADFAGSPPRVRGKDTVSFIMINEKRITPACAGKSRNYAHIRSQGKDHPRVCGEKSEKLLESYRLSESPPRVRGKVVSSN